MEITKEIVEDLYCVKKMKISDIAFELKITEYKFHVIRESLGIPKRNRERCEDLTNREFGNWTIISKSHKNQRVLWRCRCRCGSECDLHSCSLKGGRSTKCRKCVHASLSSNIILPNFYWAKVLVGAKKRSLTVTVTQEYCRNLFHKQQGKCALTGVVLYFGKCVREFKEGLNTASLDRIDSNLGYIQGNLQWTHKIINNMKQELGQMEFKEWCRKVVDHE